MKSISFIGLPGSGKGTQSNLLVENFNFIMISPGKALRRNKLIKGAVIVDSATIAKILSEEIKLSIEKTMNAEDSKAELIKNENFYQNSTILFDGFPRIIDQIDLYKIDVAIYLKSNDDIVTRRLLNRNTGRNDDKLEIIRDRTKQFYESTNPVVEEFRKRGVLIEVDANMSKKEVFDDISNKLEAFGFVKTIK